MISAIALATILNIWNKNDKYTAKDFVKSDEKVVVKKENREYKSCKPLWEER